MFTGYFAQLNKYKEAGLTPISICGKAPDWYTGLQYKKLAPKWDFFNEWKSGSHKGDNDYYIENFNEKILNVQNPQTVLAELESLGNISSDKIILLCYEKPCDFCHRHLVAKWFSDSNINCLEFRIIK